MEITEVLKLIGLDDKEASVYLALLELGTADVSDIAKKASIKRPTCYLVLDELKKRGLVSQVPAKINLFTAESPSKLSRDLYKKQELLKRFLPNLEVLHNAKKEKPQVRLFEGVEGVKIVYENIYAAGEVRFFGTPSQILKIDASALWGFIKKVKSLNLKVWDLMGQNPLHLEYAKKAVSEKNYQIRFLPKGQSFLTDSALYGDKAVFFAFNPQIFAVEIQSKEISHALRTLFEFAWQTAEPYEKVVKN